MKFPIITALISAIAVLAPVFALSAENLTSMVMDPSSLAPSAGTGLYYPNRTPLLPTQFMKLPVGSIIPKGWLRKQLELDASGMVGHMGEISDYIFMKDNGWTDPNGKQGWEELTYWLRGYGDLGYVLGDEKITADAKKWMDAVITSQKPDGWFGPEGARTSLDGGPDLWPHMPLLNALRSYYEFSGDKRVIPFLMKFFKYQDTLPAETYKRGWGAVRWGDNLDTVYWLYNRTGENWLLGLATKMHENSADYTNTIPTWHNVNLAQGIREPAEYWQQAKDKKYLNATIKDYKTVMDLYGQFAGGGFAGDENCRQGYGDPRQGFETCGWVEYMHTFEMMSRITADTVWADRCEEIAFNSFPAALDPAHRGTHYITSANSIRLEDKSRNHSQFGNGPMPMQAYMPGVHNYRCCTHNLGMGWPYYAEELWLATADNGLCASLYSASSVRAKVANGSQVIIDETTDYPFSDTITLNITANEPIKFPLYMRIPGWCDKPEIKVNGKTVKLNAGPSSYAIISAIWKTGDTVVLKLPMKLGVRTWAKNKNSVSVDYGPLTFSLAIKEQWNPIKGPDKWSGFEVLPLSAWNYGLDLKSLDAGKLSKTIKVIRKPGIIADQPFTPETAPISLQIKARKIANWQDDGDGVVSVLQQSPAKSDAPLETVTLLPMGSQRLRITTFPTVSTTGAEWKAPYVAPVWPKASASFIYDDINAMKDDSAEPADSIDMRVARFTFWDHKGTSEWVQYDFEKPTDVCYVSLYWFDDTGWGQCRIPASWSLFYKDGNDWKAVEDPSPYGVEVNKYNKVTFKQITTSALRVEVKLKDNFSGGILRWRFGK